MTDRVRTILDTAVDGTQVTVQIGGRSRTLHLSVQDMGPVLDRLTDLLEQHKTDPGWADNAGAFRYQDLVVAHMERVREHTTLFLDGTDGQAIQDGVADWDPHDQLDIAAVVAARQIAVVLHWIASQCGPDVTAAGLWADYRLADTVQKASGR